MALEEVVKMLLYRLDIHTNTGDEDGNTPQFWSAGELHKTVVKVLQLRDDSSPDIENIYSWMPLSGAARSAYE